DRDPQRRFTGRGLWWSAAAIAAAIAIALFAPPQAQRNQGPVAQQRAEDKSAGEITASTADDRAETPDPVTPEPEIRSGLAGDDFDFGASGVPTTASPRDNAPLLARSDPTSPPPGPLTDTPAGAMGEESMRSLRAPEPAGDP